MGVCNSHPHVVVCARLLSRVTFLDPRTKTCRAPPSVGFPRQEYWSGLPFPPPGDLPNPGIKPVSPASAGGCLTTEPPGKFQLTPGGHLLQHAVHLWSCVSSQEVLLGAGPLTNVLYKKARRHNWADLSFHVITLQLQPRKGRSTPHCTSPSAPGLSAFPSLATEHTQQPFLAKLA